MASQKAIGPTFYEELLAAGFTGGIAWDTTGDITYSDQISQAQRTIVEQVYAAHDPTKQLPASTSTGTTASAAPSTPVTSTST